MLLAADVEAQRLVALDRYDVLDTPREDSFDSIARLARKLFQVPIAVVSVIDGHRQWYKAAVGIESTEAPRADTFCNTTIKADEPLIVHDAATDPRFAQNPYVVGEPRVRFYAGVPLRTKDGHNIGSLCAVDIKPREFSSEQVELLYDLARLAMNELELRQLVATDVLTNVMSRRAFKDEAGRAVALALRHHHDLSCIMLDLDHFKRVNDLCGHAAGDRVLSRVADACRAVLRGTDLIGRLGGEEFAMVLPQTPPSAAREVAEKLRNAISNISWEGRPLTSGISASLGVASLNSSTRGLDQLLEHADLALYEAKAAGRDRVVAWGAAEGTSAPQRRRVLKGGQLIFNDQSSIVDCTVRGLSEDGAGLDVYSSVGIPKSFDLVIKADGFSRRCRMVSRTEKHLEVEFA